MSYKRGAPNVLSLSCGTPSGAPLLSGAPLAATHEFSAGAICKRRDAVRLALREGLQPRVGDGVPSAAVRS
jgi:hypothetical protein